MNNKIIKMSLDPLRTKEYFLDHINGGGALGDLLREKMDLSKGSFFIFLLETCNFENLYKFSVGWINPLEPAEKGDYIQNKGYTHTTSGTTFWYVSEYIKGYLDASEEHRAICEDVIQSPSDPHVEMPNIESHFYEKHVYYSLSKKNSIEEIYKVIRRTDQDWQSLCVLLDEVELPKELKKEDFANIVANTQYIATSAHDGENCIFWERSTD